MFPRTTTSQDGSLTIIETLFDKNGWLGVKTVMNVTSPGVIFQLIESDSNSTFRNKPRTNYKDKERYVEAWVTRMNKQKQPAAQEDYILNMYYEVEDYVKGGEEEKNYSSGTRTCTATIMFVPDMSNKTLKEMGFVRE